MSNHELINQYLKQQKNFAVLALVENQKYEEIRSEHGIELLIDFVRYCLQEGTTNDELSDEEVLNINFLKHEILGINNIDLKQCYNPIKFLVEEELIMMFHDDKLDPNEIDIKIHLKDIFDLTDKDYQEMGDAHIRRFLLSLNARQDYYEIKKLRDNKIISHQLWDEINNPIMEGTMIQKRSRHIPKDVQSEVWKRDNGKCVECGSNEFIEFDHIVPFSKGGSNTARNIQLLCEKCNRKKYNNI